MEQHGKVPQWRMNGRWRAAGWRAEKEGGGRAAEGVLGIVKAPGLDPEPQIY